MDQNLIPLRWRLALAAPLLAGFVKWIFYTPAEGTFMDAMPLVLGMLCLLGSAVILCRPLVQLIAEPAGWLFYSARPQDPAPAEPIHGADNYETAIAKLEQLAQEFPDDPRPHEEMIRIAMLNLQDPDRAERLYRRSLQVLQRPEAQNAIGQCYQDAQAAARNNR